MATKTGGNRLVAEARRVAECPCRTGPENGCQNGCAKAAAGQMSNLKTNRLTSSSLSFFFSFSVWPLDWVYGMGLV